MGNSKSVPRHHPGSSSRPATAGFDSRVLPAAAKSGGIYPHEIERQRHSLGSEASTSGIYPHEASIRNDCIKFHSTHGINIEITDNGKVASRTNSFCFAIAFTSRPIGIEERVHFNLKTVETGWSGVMRFGLTSKNPAMLQPNDLPRYVCPDLTNQPGCWAKAVPEQFATQNNVLSFHFNHSGVVFYSVNNRMEGIFLSNVDISKPLWGIVDIYGNTMSLQLIDDSGPTSLPLPSLPPDMELQVRRRFSVMQSIKRIGFSATMGRQIKCRNRTLITRHENDWDSTLAFTNTPLTAGESLYMYCACADSGQPVSFLRQMAFGIGVTTCDPSKILVSELPVDSDAILDRPEYWIMFKDLEPPHSMEYFRLTVETSGCLTYSRESQEEVVLFHMDISQPLHLVFDLCANVKSLAIIGISKAAVEPNHQADVVENVLPTLNIHGNDALGLNHMDVASFSNEDHAQEAEQASLPRDDVLQPVSGAAAPTAATDYMTVGEVAAMSAPLVLSALSWLGSTVTSRLRSDDDEVVQESEEEVPTDASSSSDGESGEGARDADDAEAEEDFFNARDEAEDSSDDHSLEDDFAINSRLLDMLNTDLDELLRPLEYDALPTRRTSSGDQAAPRDLDNKQASLTDQADLASQIGAVSPDKECVVCCDSQVNAVVYTCGHACMCYQCGQIILRQRSPTCPICRARVKDIIRIYQA